MDTVRGRGDEQPAGAEAVPEDVYCRVEAYLVACRVMHRHRLHRLASEAAGRLAASPAVPTALAAVADIDAGMAGWFRRVLDTEQVPAETLCRRGRLALLLANAFRSWPQAVFAPPPWPVGFAEQVRACSLQSVPLPTPGAMDSPPIDLGRIPRLTDAALRRLDRSRWLRFLLLAACFATVFGLLFHMTR